MASDATTRNWVWSRGGGRFDTERAAVEFDAHGAGARRDDGAQALERPWLRGDEDARKSGGERPHAQQPPRHRRERGRAPRVVPVHVGLDAHVPRLGGDRGAHAHHPQPAAVAVGHEEPEGGVGAPRGRARARPYQKDIILQFTAPRRIAPVWCGLRRRWTTIR